MLTELSSERGLVVGTNSTEQAFVGDFDEAASPLGAKGLGELTAVSVAPTRSITRPANVSESCRSPWKSCCEYEGPSEDDPCDGGWDSR